MKEKHLFINQASTISINLLDKNNESGKITKVS